MPQIKIQTLKALLRIEELGSIRAAEASLHVSQPALSLSIHQLEEEVGAPLLVRTKRGVSFTSYGQALLQHARLMVSESQRIQEEIAPMRSPLIAGRKIAVVPVLRAGLGMAEGLMDLTPSARQDHIGLYRGEDHRPVEYYVRLPDVEERRFIVCDPIVGTGHSAARAVSVLIEHGVAPSEIRFLALVASPEGVTHVAQCHPGVSMYVAGLDSHLNEHACIVPGLVNAGDRIFGTQH